MLSKKSPQTSCRIRIRNDRIGANGFLNQRCALAPDLESILRARMSKIVFRQHRSKGDILGPSVHVSFTPRERTSDRTFGDVCYVPDAAVSVSSPCFERLWVRRKSSVRGDAASKLTPTTTRQDIPR